MGCFGFFVADQSVVVQSLSPASSGLSYIVFVAYFAFVVVYYSSFVEVVNPVFFLGEKNAG